jgi:hypothetical protein
MLGSSNVNFCKCLRFDSRCVFLIFMKVFTCFTHKTGGNHEFEHKNIFLFAAALLACRRGRGLPRLNFQIFRFLLLFLKRARLTAEQGPAQTWRLCCRCRECGIKPSSHFPKAESYVVRPSVRPSRGLDTPLGQNFFSSILCLFFAHPRGNFSRRVRKKYF